MSGAESGQRYFCHQCNATCIPQAPEFLCPTCNEGFIEPVTSPPPLPTSMFSSRIPEDIEMGAAGGNPALRSSIDAFSRAQVHRHMEALHLHDLRSLLQGYPPSSAASTPGGRAEDAPSTTTSNDSPDPSSSAVPSAAQSSRAAQGSRAAQSNRAGHGARGGTSSRIGGHSHRIHTSNVSPNSAGISHSGLFPGAGGTSRLRFVLGDSLTGDGNTDVPTLFSMIMSGLSGDQQPMVGNPGDYAWGPTGLDNIISQLIGQLDGSGPPPAQEQTIDSLPEVYLAKKHIENKLDCTVCQEYFTEDVKVKELPCKHFFHIDCIVPWLKLHNSCPICRVSIDGQQESGGVEDVVMSDEDMLPELEDHSPNTRTETTQPASTQHSSNISQHSTSQQVSSQSQTIHEDDLD